MGPIACHLGCQFRGCRSGWPAAAPIRAHPHAQAGRPLFHLKITHHASVSDLLPAGARPSKLSLSLRACRRARAAKCREQQQLRQLGHQLERGGERASPTVARLPASQPVWEGPRPRSGLKRAHQHSGASVSLSGTGRSGNAGQGERGGLGQPGRVCRPVGRVGGQRRLNLCQHWH